MRSYAPSSTVAAARVPLYQLGFLTDGERRRARGRMYRSSPMVLAPKAPLYQLGGMGADPAKIVGATAPILATTTSTILASTAWSAAAGPIGAAVGLLVGVIAGLWSAHEARVKGAQTENVHANSVVQTFDAALRAIFAAANSSDPTQNIDPGTAASQCQQLLAQCWQQLARAQGLPGVADNSGWGASCGSYTPGVTTPCSPGHPCDKSCTAGCCIGCNDLWPSILDAITVFQNPNGGTVNVCTVYGSKYGASQRGGYSLTYKPPTISGGSLTAGSLTAALTGGSGGSSWLPLLALGVGAFFLLR
jgi:hypothetical protein